MSTDIICLQNVEKKVKVKLSASKKNFTLFVSLMKNAFYFILKALFVLKIFKFLTGLFDHVEKTA